MSFLSKTAAFEEASDQYGSIGDPSLLFTQISTKNFSNTVEQKTLRITTQKEKTASFLAASSHLPNCSEPRGISPARKSSSPWKRESKPGE